uniref:Uncharacterized protein n=1 Tax=Arundo donax TaxID=35708 RepID=A0A0A9B607_ARUDO
MVLNFQYSIVHLDYLSALICDMPFKACSFCFPLNFFSVYAWAQS